MLATALMGAMVEGGEGSDYRWFALYGCSPIPVGACPTAFAAASHTLGLAHTPCPYLCLLTAGSGGLHGRRLAALP